MLIRSFPSCLFSLSTMLRWSALVLLSSTLCLAQIELNIGLMFVRNVSRFTLTSGYQTSAAAVLIARDRIEKEEILPGYKINFTVRFDECVESLAAGYSVELMRDLKVDAIIGPTCSSPALAAGVLANYYNVPLFTWGSTTSSTLDNKLRFPTVSMMSVRTFSLGMSISSVLRKFDWTEFGFIYSNQYSPEKCENIKNDLQDALDEFDDISMSYLRQISDISTAGMTNALANASLRARVFVVCFAEGYNLKRRFMLAAYDGGYTTDEYVYIFADTRSKGFVVPLTDNRQRFVWESSGESDGRDADARVAFQKTFAISDMMGSGELSVNYTEFGKNVIARMSEAPFYCTTECADSNYSVVSTFAGQLHDSLLGYAYALNKTLERNPKNIRNGTQIISNAVFDFEGISGTVKMNVNGSRNPTFYFIGLNSSGEPVPLEEIYVDGTSTTLTTYYSSEAEVFTYRENSARPLAVPICGFTGTQCPFNFVEQYLVWVILAGLVVFLAIAAAIIGVIYSFHAKRKEEERLNMMWQISNTSLRPVQRRNKGDQSYRSLSSGHSSIGTKTTTDSKIETRNFKFFLLENEKVVAMKHAMKIRLLREETVEMRQLRNLEHDNLNRFIGLCLDAPDMMSIWKYCGRGSLRDVVQKSSITMDYFFVYSLIRDITQGLAFIHKSHLKFHGYLTSENCLVDDRFQVKLSYFGLQKFRQFDKLSNEDLLWTAPEVLRGQVSPGSPQADIFSLAIICSELVTKKPAWDVENRKEPAETLIYWLKRDRADPPRPDLTVHESLDINHGLIELIRDCWAQDPDRRPTIDQIRTLLRGMLPGRNDNLMDHVFNIMESYAATLEEEVEGRMKELVEEKKKSDILLYRMLPKQVAEKLKMGQSVQPETFESVTVFFSDVVSFTTLASRCSPLQVVNLLNDLYSMFDGIIETHDVYKVETIGDGYLCVSGLPHRNGNEHVKEVASMSLELMDCLKTFRIPHLPTERINLRIGIHCGSVVTGVVGLTMPRYCLFGDTVNTASRMESNGKPGHIHLSGEANFMIEKVVGGFRTESRGEVIIKGKGVMETFWLLGKSDDNQLPEPVHSIMKGQPKVHQSHKSPSPSFSDTKTASPVPGLYTDFKKNTTGIETINYL